MFYEYLIYYKARINFMYFTVLISRLFWSNPPLVMYNYFNIIM
jgi:hypothetical protein